MCQSSVVPEDGGRGMGGLGEGVGGAGVWVGALGEMGVEVGKVVQRTWCGLGVGGAQLARRLPAWGLGSEARHSE